MELVSLLPPPGGSTLGRPSVPSVIPEDEEHEDTLMVALRPLREAEQGRPPTAAPRSAAPTSLPPELLAAATAEEKPPEVRAVAVPVGIEACLSHVGVAVIETDADRIIVGLNAVAERLTGWPAVEAQGRHVDEVFLLAAPTSRGTEATLATELGDAPPEHTALLERRDGQVLPVRHVVGVAAPRLSDLDATASGGPGEVIVFRDVSGQQFLALQLARQVRYDTLTGLLNRQALAERIDQAMAQSRRSGAVHALCYLDLDRFRLVTSTCGHDAGDDLLQWVATRVNELLGPSDSAGRIGGDEFALLLIGRDVREAERVARELQRRLLEFRFGWQDKTFAVGASFGVVPFGAEMGNAAEVLGAADHACRIAKEAGRGRIQIYLESDDQMAQSRRSIQWVAGLQKNLEDGRLRLFAQTITPLSARAGKGAHFEVLVRRVDEQGRFLSPVGIIQAAEHSGMMDAIDRFVVRQAFRMIGALPQRAMRRLDTCAINLSGISLLREGLLDFIVKEMHKANVPPSKICFEVTETAALANLGEVLWLMQELGAMGCRFAIDDFGSGHASYGYLENLPVDYVKIDGMFVRDLPDNALHRAIIESVHRIGCTLGIRTVAEAVETQAIADLLVSIGVDYAQGWLYGKPAPLTDVLAALDSP
jgi:diguanylate cyclase (GGDEF)-like protein/PAS domain S-box-containing protein